VELEDPYQHKTAFQRFRLQDLAEDLGLEDHEFIPSDDEPDVLPDGGLDWKDVSHEYWSELKEFDRRHPPRYVDPHTPSEQDSVDYFPHRHFQEAVRDAAGSQELYREVMDAVRFQEYGVGAVLDSER